MESKNIVIIGASGFGREVLWLIREYNLLIKPKKNKNSIPYNIIGFVDDNTSLQGEFICDIQVVGPIDWLLKNNDVYAVCAIGNPRIRIRVTKALEEKGVKFTSIIHPSVKMSQFVEIGIGCIICAGTIITTQVKIGNHVHINLNTTIGHDVIINDFVTIAPGVNISGNVNIGIGADLGTNCSIIQSISIGKGSIIGAGAVVSKDIEKNTVSVGIPAKPIKKISEEL